MIVLSNSAVQTLAPGEAITFDVDILHTGCGECHRKNASSVKLKSCGVYGVSFGANVSGATAGDVVQLAFSLGGDILPETTMMATSGVADQIHEVARTTGVKVCCGDYSRLTVVNTGAVAVTVQPNSSLFIHRLG